jgi:hypothetical protein
VGRVQRQVRRAFIASNGRALTTAQLARWCYARGGRLQPWHYRNIKQAARRWAIQIDRCRGGRGHAVTWQPRPDFLRSIFP